ncbi:hypothetical protein [Marinobacter sp. LV10R510-11A]|nr:hypothetical protein [Marinobacter sp. LV10R510-11A]
MALSTALNREYHRFIYYLDIDDDPAQMLRNVSLVYSGRQG